MVQIYNKELLLEKYKNFTWGFEWLHDFEVADIIQKLKDYEWRFVGGCVRDSLIGYHTYDIDINTPLLPDDVISIFKDYNISEVGKAHGTIMIFCKNYKFEITTLRRDVINMGRKAIVDFNSNWKFDSDRRDFTINALMLDVKEMKIYDYHNGIEDLNLKLIKFIGDAHQRIQEDYLRILRFIRFSIRFVNFNMENSINFINLFKDLKNIQPLVTGLSNIAIERIIQELVIILKAKQWINGVQAMKYLKIDEDILGITFNETIDDLTKKGIIPMSLEDKLICIFFKNDNKKINKLPLPSISKKNIIKINYDPKIFYDVENLPILQWFNMDMENLNLLKIKIILHKFDIQLENKLLQEINRLIEAKNDYNFQSQWGNIKKNIIQKYEGKSIGIMIEKKFYDLWRN